MRRKVDIGKDGASGQWTMTREVPPQDRRRLLNQQNASFALQGLSRDREILGLTKGQFSLIDLIRASLDVCGPAGLVISTWTAAKKEIDDAARLLKDHRILSCQWLVDFSFPSRQPAYCSSLRDRFGDDAIRVTKNHAKFVLIRNSAWQLVIRTSMNLNRNARLEYFSIVHSPPLAEFFGAVIEELFRLQPAGSAFTDRPIEHVRGFDAFGKEPVIDTGDEWGVSLDDPLHPGMSLL